MLFLSKLELSKVMTKVSFIHCNINNIPTTQVSAQYMFNFDKTMLRWLQTGMHSIMYYNNNL